MEKSERVKILFVCFGNTCRSPMAEAIFKNLLKQRNLEDKFEVDSAGTSDLHVGEEASNFVKVILERNKISINHRSRQIKSQDLINFDFLVCMDNKNQNALDDLVSKAASNARVLLLGSFDPKSSEVFIKDPYGGSQEDFENCFTKISDSCVVFLNHLVKNEKESNS